MHDSGFIYGNHWHCKCKYGPVRQFIIQRHDVVRDWLARAGKELQLHIETELLGLYANSKGKPADVLFPSWDPQLSKKAQAVDVVVTDPRSQTAMASGADKCSLAAASLKESKKLLDHHKMIAHHGPGIITFDRVPFAVESSGAWGKSAKALWHKMKGKAKEIKLQNYVMANKPRTWSAFTFGSFYSQAISFAVAKCTAQAVLRGLKSSRC